MAEQKLLERKLAELKPSEILRILKQVTLYYSLITLSLVPPVNHHTVSLNIKLSYNLSFLNCDQVIGAFYGTALLNYKICKQCHCKACKDLIEIQKLGFDVSFLKVSQLLVDGDIELNPVPVTGTPIGRKAKKRTFSFFPQKSDANRVQEMIDDTIILRTSNLLGLKNIGRNVCFFLIHLSKCCIWLTHSVSIYAY